MKKTSIILVLSMVLMAGIYSVLAMKIKADIAVNEEMNETFVPIEMYSNEELIEMTNEYNSSMGFKHFEDAKVKESGEYEYLISSEKQNQVVIIWYEKEDGEWKVDYEHQPHVRYF